MTKDIKSKVKINIAITANTGWYIYNFRLNFIKFLSFRNYKVYIICPKDKYSERLIDMGFSVYYWNLNRKSLNLFFELLNVFRLIKIYSKIKPEIVHHFTLKACLYGTISASLCRINNIINSITGIGSLFISKSIKTRIILFSFRYVFSYIFKNLSKKLIFQNTNDRNFFIKRNLISMHKSVVIPGSGIDINQFKPKNKKINLKEFKLLFPSRILKEKGIIELIDACKLLWNINLPIILFIAGDLDPGNRSSLTIEELNKFRNNKNIKLLGHIENIREIYEKVDVVVLPSWREGLSRSLLEAASMQKAIITTNVPGCKEIVEDNKTGLIVNIRNPKDIKRSILKYYRNPYLIKKYGEAARVKVIKEFEVQRINSLTINQYK